MARLAPSFIPVDRATQGDFLALTLAAQRACGDVFSLHLGPPQVVVCHPELAHEILVARADIYAKLGAAGKAAGLARMLGKGLLTNSDPVSWRRQRQMIQPAFHREGLERFRKVIKETAATLLERLHAAKGRPFNLSEAIYELTLHLTQRLIFSTPPEAKTRLEVPLSLATARTVKVKEKRRALKKRLADLIAERERLRASGTTPPGDILDMLLEARDAETGEAMGKTQLMDELLTLFAAGHETLANALIWSFYMLAQTPEVEARLVEALQGKGEIPAYAVAVFKESLRRYPTIPTAPRIVLEDSELAGFHLSAGTRVLVSFYALHHHPYYWTEPEVFRPVRFLENPPHPYTYLPFGLGARYCVGRNLAMLEGPLLLATVARAFSLSLLEGHKLTPKVTISLGPRQALWILPSARRRTS